jgi:hypothetical protein
MELRVGGRKTLLFAFDLEIMEPERGPDSRCCLVRNYMYMYSCREERTLELDRDCPDI